jgi:hypothetical protein
MPLVARARRGRGRGGATWQVRPIAPAAEVDDLGFDIDPALVACVQGGVPVPRGEADTELARLRAIQEGTNAAEHRGERYPGMHSRITNRL